VLGAVGRTPALPADGAEGTMVTSTCDNPTRAPVPAPDAGVDSARLSGTTG